MGTGSFPEVRCVRG